MLLPVEHDVWPFEDDSVDLVVACEIFEHLAMDPMTLFAGGKRGLKPGGYFLHCRPTRPIFKIPENWSIAASKLAQHFRRPFSIARLYERHSRE